MESLNFYKLSFYVPESHLEVVKQALFDAGAGRQGNYDHCCWQCLGQGQFKPLENANPSLGSQHSLTFVPEYKVEMLCSSEFLHKAVAALKKNHPYEEPAFEVLELVNKF